MWSRISSLIGIVVVVQSVVACAPPQSPATDAGASAPAAVPKHIIVGVGSDFNALSTRLVRSGSGSRPGAAELERLVHAGLTQMDPNSVLQPQLVETVPTTDNGLWKILADGRMETTWKIRPGAVWHDGTPFTAQDLIFTGTVGRDRELASFRDPTVEMTSGMSAPDPKTLVVEWKQPFIGADTLFGVATQLPLPKHLLEGPYLENKMAFDSLPYWSEGFVGAGPYKVREWLLGSYLILDADPRYALGRPKIDSIEVKFFADPNVMDAVLIAGAMDLPLGSRTTSIDQAREIEKRANVTITYNPGSPLSFWPQLRVPNPAIVGDARFRRAMLQALNRQEMADTFVDGLAGVADTLLTTEDPEYKDLERSIVRYLYDPRAAGQAIEALGYVRGPDGFFRDAGGERLTVEVRSSSSDILNKSKLAAADYWQRIGVTVNPLTESEAQRSNVENRATFPGFETRRGSGGTNGWRELRSSEARVPERGYVGINVSNYMNPELDALIDRFFVTIPREPRMETGRRILHHVTDQVIPLMTYYDVGPRVIGARVKNVATSGNIMWAPNEWDVKS